MRGGQAGPKSAKLQTSSQLCVRPWRLNSVRVLDLGDSAANSTTLRNAPLVCVWLRRSVCVGRAAACADPQAQDASKPYRGMFLGAVHETLLHAHRFLLHSDIAPWQDSGVV